MRFRGHFLGGILAATFCTWVGARWSLYSLSWKGVQRAIFSPLREREIYRIVGYFSLTLFMSLFPDLDTDSIPQRYFVRIFFFLLLLLYLIGRGRVDYFFPFALVAFLCLFPLLFKHRGWTHSTWSPWVLGGSLLLLREYVYGRGFSLFTSLSPLFSSRKRAEPLFFLFCIFVGHYTHLFLDSSLVRSLRRKSE